MRRQGDIGLARTPFIDVPRQIAALAAAVLGALALGWVVARGHVGLAAAAVLAAPLLVLVGRSPRRAFALALLLILFVPASKTLGVAQLNVLRLATFFALTAVFLDLYASPAIRQRFTGVDLAVFGYAAYTLVGWEVGTKSPHSSAFAINYILPFAFYVAARRFTGRMAQAILAITFVGAALAALTVLFEAFVAHRPLFADTTSYYWNATTLRIFRPGGVFGSPPNAASVLSMSILCGLPLLTCARGRYRTLLVSCLGLSVLALVLTFTRAPMIGLALGIVVYGVLLGPSAWARYVYVGSTIAVITVLAVLPQIQGTNWFQKGVLRDGTLASRQVVWDETRSVITSSRQHEFFGHGVNSLVVGLPWLPGQPVSDIARVPALTLQGPQDQYIRTLIESGVVGLLLMSGWLFGSFARGVRASFGAQERRREIAAATAACSAFGVLSLLDDSLRQPQTFVVIAVLTGMIVSLSTHRRDTSRSELTP